MLILEGRDRSETGYAGGGCTGGNVDRPASHPGLDSVEQDEYT